jgi:hypothetical protein
MGKDHIYNENDEKLGQKVLMPAQINFILDSADFQRLAPGILNGKTR